MNAELGYYIMKGPPWRLEVRPRNVSSAWRPLLELGPEDLHSIARDARHLRQELNGEADAYV